MKKLLYCILGLLIIGCSGNKTANKASKPREPLAAFIEDAYKKNVTDFHSLITNDTLKSQFTLDREKRFHKYVQDGFKYCRIDRDSDMAYHMIYYTIEAYRDSLPIGDFARIVVRTYDTPDHETVTGEMGPITLQVNGLLVDENGEWKTGKWEPVYKKSEDAYATRSKENIRCLELRVGNCNIEVGDILVVHIDGCANATQIRIRDENKTMHRIKVDETNSNSSHVCVTDRDEVKKLLNLFETKEKLYMSFVDNQDRILGKMSIIDHNAGCIIGALLKYVLGESVF